MDEQIDEVERWSKLHALPLRVKVHLKAKMFGETTGPTLVDILNQQTLKPKSPVMRGEILRTLDLEHMFQLDQVRRASCVRLGVVSERAVRGSIVDRRGAAYGCVLLPRRARTAAMATSTRAIYFSAAQS
jgi:hypothetical protein